MILALKVLRKTLFRAVPAGVSLERREIVLTSEPNQDKPDKRGFAAWEQAVGVSRWAITEGDIRVGEFFLN